MEQVEEETASIVENKKSKKRWRKRKQEGVGSDNGENCIVRKVERLQKRVTLCVSKPSYVLRSSGSVHLRSVHRDRLCRILTNLISQRDWVDASGVLAVLLQATFKDHSRFLNRFKFQTAMELLNHIGCEDNNFIDIDGIYDTWMTRVGVDLSKKRRRTGQKQEDSFLVRLESILSRLIQGNIDTERHNARSLVQEHQFECHPMFNMIIGLIFCHLWYSSIPEALLWKDSDQVLSPSQSDMSVTPLQSYRSSGGVSNEAGNEEVHNTVSTSVSNDVTHSALKYDSETSVRNDKPISADTNRNIGGEDMLMDVDIKRENLLENTQQEFYGYSSENEDLNNFDAGQVQYAPNLSALQSLGSWLLPIRVENWQSHRVNLDDDYWNAVRYLQQAVHASPPVSAALLPLVQLLLIGCNYGEALNEVEMFCGNSSAALPLRLRAIILECVDPKSIKIPTYFEDAFKSDPTCSQSLSHLIILHQKGDFGAESLLEMIALHLDAVIAEHNTWKELASCFLKVSESEEDRMSACLNENEHAQSRVVSVRYSKIPKFLVQGTSGKSWSLRCRWWLSRHFSPSILASETAAGGLQLLTYKAACASHIYGKDFEYVAEAYKCVEKGNDRDLLKFLKLHIKNSIVLQTCFQSRTK